MLNIRTADKDDLDIVKDFYWSLIDSFKYMEYGPGWIKGVYPAEEYLSSLIANGELYIGETDGNMVSCMAVNHAYNEGYKKVKWSVEATDDELYVIHILAVVPECSGKGIAKQMVGKVIEMARENNVKTIRLDVLMGNIPAEKAYSKMGFKYLETIPMFYEDTGWMDFKLFEFII